MTGEVSTDLDDWFEPDNALTESGIMTDTPNTSDAANSQAETTERERLLDKVAALVLYAMEDQHRSQTEFGMHTVARTIAKDILALRSQPVAAQGASERIVVNGAEYIRNDVAYQLSLEASDDAANAIAAQGAIDEQALRKKLSEVTGLHPQHSGTVNGIISTLKDFGIRIGASGERTDTQRLDWLQANSVSIDRDEYEMLDNWWRDTVLGHLDNYTPRGNRRSYGRRRHESHPCCTDDRRTGPHRRNTMPINKKGELVRAHNGILCRMAGEIAEERERSGTPENAIELVTEILAYMDRLNVSSTTPISRVELLRILAALSRTPDLTSIETALQRAKDRSRYMRSHPEVVHDFAALVADEIQIGTRPDLLGKLDAMSDEEVAKTIGFDMDASDALRKVVVGEARHDFRSLLTALLSGEEATK